MTSSVSTFTVCLKFCLEMAGFTMIALAIGHLYISRLLNWKSDLQKLTPINEQVFYAHTLFIVCGLLCFGIALMVVPSVLIEQSVPALVMSCCLAICWAGRLIFQFRSLGSKISDDKRIDFGWRTLATCLWIYYTILFSVLFLYQVGVVHS